MARFFKLSDAADSLSGLNFDARSSPAVGDFDGDGDLDLVLGSTLNLLSYVSNVGTSTDPQFELKSGTGNPFTGLDVSLTPRPTVGDVDGDGDLDLLTSNAFNTFLYFRNTGTALAPVYEQITGDTDPFRDVFQGSGTNPLLADLDGDRDLDLVVGRQNGRLAYYENTGSSGAPSYVERTGDTNPFAGIQGINNAMPTLIDVDGDTDQDLVLGDGDFGLLYYENTGTVPAPVFSARTGADNPFNGLDTGQLTDATAADIDADGDMDLIVGNRDGTLRTLINNDAPTLRDAVQVTLSGIDEDTAASATFTVDALLPSPAVWGDVDAGALKGLAVVDTGANGTWQYSLNGSTWTPVGAVSDSAALLLSAETSMRFVPDGQNGETASLTFRAWDQSSGSASTDTGAGRSTGDARINGGASAFSTNTIALAVTVTPLNDAPTLSQSAITLTGTDEDTTSSATTVAALLTAVGQDDVDTGALKGLAVTGSTGAGTWQYNTGGVAWTPFSAVSATSALLLSASTSVRYVPDALNGETATLSFRAWDQTSGTASTDGTTRTADTTTNGGTTAFSTASSTASLVVTPVNDAPTTSPVTLLPAMPEDSGTRTITQAMLLANAADADGPALKAENLQIVGSLGNLVDNGNGSWNFTPAPNDDTSVSFSYRISDGTDTVAGSATLDLTPVNDAPLAVADSAVTRLNAPVSIAVLANDSDVDGGPLRVVATTPGSAGTAAVQPGGLTVLYTPNTGFSGFDNFSYTVSDGVGGSTTANVRVLVASITGSNGNDTLLGTQQADFVVGLDGADRILVHDGADYVDAGRGADTITGGAGADTLLGGDGPDTFLATSSELAGDQIDGGEGSDLLIITNAPAALPANFSFTNLELISYTGALLVEHTSLLDLSSLTLASGSSNSITGGTANSRITGTASADNIVDSAGNDDLRGAAGNDTIMGGFGQDTIYGGTGNDVLYGGSATAANDFVRDIFVFNTPLNGTTNVDQIIGFQANSQDQIQLSGSIFSAVTGGATPGLDAGEFLSVNGGNAVDGNDFILFDPLTGNLFYDADGSGLGAKVLFATLVGLTGTLDATDFVSTGSFSPV